MSGSVGLWFGDPSAAVGVQARGIADVPASTGEVLAATAGSAWAGSIGPRIADWWNRTEDTNPHLDADAANAKYGIPGVLKFDRPVSESIASALARDHEEEQQRQAIIARRPNNLATSMVGRGAVSFGTAMLDPVNLGLALVPFVGEARMAMLLGTTSRTAARAGAGAVGGGGGMLLAEPVERALSRAEFNDRTMTDTLASVAFGSVLGGGLHVLGGAIGDAVSRRRTPSPVERAIGEASQEVRDGMLRGAASAVAEGRPVGVAALMDIGAARGAVDDLERAARRYSAIDAERTAASDAARRVAAPDRSAAIDDAMGSLSALRRDRASLHSEAGALREQGIRQSMDPDTAARLAAVENDLASTITAARRQSLEAERTMLMEGRNVDRPAPSAALEVERTNAQLAGVHAGLTRIDDAIARAEGAVDRLRATDRAAFAAAEDRNVATASRAGLVADRVAAQETLLDEMASKAMRRIAGDMGFRVDLRDAADLGRAVVRGELSPADAMEALERWRRAAPDDALLPNRPDFETMKARLQQRADDATARALEELANAPRANPEDVAASRMVAEAAIAADAPPRAVPRPAGEAAPARQSLAAADPELTRAIAEGDAKMAQLETLALTPGEAAQIKALREGIDAAESDARAHEAAALCMVGIR